jgi:uncharacterized membrane protein YebE (DUF533 family)
MEDEATVQAQVLAAMAWCDGEFDQAERMFYLAFLDATPGSDAVRAELLGLLDAPPDRGALLEAFGRLPRARGLEVLKQAYLMGMANERLQDEERALLGQLARKLGITEATLPRFYEMLGCFYRAWRLESELFRP